MAGVASTAYVTFKGKFNESVDEIAIRDSGVFPQFWVHRNGREPGNGVDFVAQEA